MATSKTGPIEWYSPNPRCIIPLESFKIPRSLRRNIRKNVFSITVSQAFEQVIVACADRPESWISSEIIGAYSQLHKLGFADSVEAWQHGVLAGGLYGVTLGAAFFGESMFSRKPEASKTCLAALVESLRRRGFLLLDSQIINDHVRQFGAIEIPRDEYMRRLAEAIGVETPPRDALL